MISGVISVILEMAGKDAFVDTFLREILLANEDRIATHLGLVSPGTLPRRSRCPVQGPPLAAFRG